MIATPAFADYRLQRGDVLEISVSGSPELHRRVMVDNDGKVYLPLLGEIKAAGSSAGQLRQKLHDFLATKQDFVNPDVTVDIAEYQPISVAGDVAKPGAYPYRAGMTVRQAIALAGGEGRGGFVDSFEARDQFGASSIKFVRLQIHVARLRAELSDRTEIDLSGVQTNGIADALIAQLIDMETQQLKTELDDHNNERTYLARVITKIQDQISVLLAEQEYREQTLLQLQKDTARAQQLFQRSLAPIARVEDEQRTISNSTTQLLELKARIAQAHRDLEDSARRLQKLADQKKIDIMQRLEAAIAELAIVEVHLATAGEKMRHIGSDKSGIPADRAGAAGFAIFRGEPGDQQQIAADKGTRLLPGDALEVTGPSAVPPSLALGNGRWDLPATGSGGGQAETAGHLPLALAVPAAKSDAAQLPAAGRGRPAEGEPRENRTSPLSASREPTRATDPSQNSALSPSRPENSGTPPRSLRSDGFRQQ